MFIMEDRTEIRTEERHDTKDVVVALNKIIAAIQSLNPDPTHQRVSSVVNYASIVISLFSLVVAIYSVFRVQSVGILLQGP
jgi:hypothetical protein